MYVKFIKDRKAIQNMKTPLLFIDYFFPTEDKIINFAA